jgi:hypothetical protein
LSARRESNGKISAYSNRRYMSADRLRRD